MQSPNISVRNCGAKLKISRSSIDRAKKQLNIRTYKKKICPKYVKNQKERADNACYKLYRKSVPSGGGHFFYHG